jgi:hypothetical protein
MSWVGTREAWKSEKNLFRKSEEKRDDRVGAEVR